MHLQKDILFFLNNGFLEQYEEYGLQQFIGNLEIKLQFVHVQEELTQFEDYLLAETVVTFQDVQVH